MNSHSFMQSSIDFSDHSDLYMKSIFMSQDSELHFLSNLTSLLKTKKWINSQNVFEWTENVHHIQYMDKRISCSIFDRSEDQFLSLLCSSDLVSALTNTNTAGDLAS